MSQKIINHQMIIDGKSTNSITEKTIEIECPSNKKIFASVPRGNEADVNIAVKSSLKAFRSWSKVKPRERGRILLKIADAIEIEKEGIAKIIATETGNAIKTQARPEINLVVDIFR